METENKKQENEKGFGPAASLAILAVILGGIVGIIAVLKNIFL